MLVINPEECIDCGVCEPECPIEAIKPDTEPEMERWVELNQNLARQWPKIVSKKDPLPDAEEWKEVQNKIQYLSKDPGSFS